MMHLYYIITKLIFMRIISSFCITLILSVWLNACAVGPDFHPPNPPGVSRYTQVPLPTQTVSSPVQGGTAQSFILGGNIPKQWWRIFHCPALNQLICRGIQHSPNLDAAKAALLQARENLQAQIGSTLVPNVSAQFTPQKQRFTSAIFGVQNAPGSVFSVYNASINVSYNLDVFGGARRQIEAMGALVDVQRFEYEATYLTLTTNIVTTSIQDAALRAQIKSTQALIKAQTEQLTIVQRQCQLGGASGADVLAKQTELANTRALLPPLEQNLAQTRHALAVLVGDFPCAGDIPQFELEALELPSKLPVSLPSQLVCQRPDVCIACALLEQANAQIGVATANLLPQFPLTGNYGSTADSIANLFTERALVWSIVGPIAQPLFNGTALICRRKAAIEAYHEAFAQYKQTVLQAFQNVADVLSALEIDAKTLQAQTAAEKAARSLLAMSEKQFRLGGVSYLDLLNAQRQFQYAQIHRIQAQAKRYQDTATLFQALGGTWWQCEKSDKRG